MPETLFGAKPATQAAERSMLSSHLRSAGGPAKWTSDVPSIIFTQISFGATTASSPPSEAPLPLAVDTGRLRAALIHVSMARSTRVTGNPAMVSGYQRRILVRFPGNDAQPARPEEAWALGMSASLGPPAEPASDNLARTLRLSSSSAFAAVPLLALRWPTLLAIALASSSLSCASNLLIPLAAALARFALASLPRSSPALL